MSRRRLSSLSSQRRQLLHRLQTDSTSPSSTLPRRPETAEKVLSSAQQRLWFLAQQEGTNATYNVPCAVRLEGSLEVEDLRRALDIIVERHESLRTTFGAVQGRPFLKIAPPQVLELPLVDLSHLPHKEAEEKALLLATEEARRPMNLETGPLFRPSLLKLQPTTHILVMTLHHIITDGWSMGVLNRELLSLLRSLARGESPALPPLKLRYQDFAWHQQEQLKTPQMQQHLSWWVEHLSGAPPLHFPDELRPNKAAETDGAHESFQLSASLTQRLRNASQKKQVSLFMWTLAAFTALLHGLSGQTDFCIGTPHASRETPEMEELIGFFVNTLVFRMRWQDEPGFHTLLQQIRQTTLQGFAHRELPFEKVVEALNPQRGNDHQPLFRTWFAMLAPEHAPGVFNYGFRSAVPVSQQLPGLLLTPVPVESGVSKFDLVILLWDTPEGIVGTFEYKTALFSRESIQLFASMLEKILENSVRNPHHILSELVKPLKKQIEGLLTKQSQQRQSSLRSRLRAKKRIH